MSYSPLIKWSGSKRYLSDRIINLFPNNIETYIEPFLGGGSVMYKTTFIKNRIGNDIITPLIDFYKNIQINSNEILSFYELKWNELKNGGDYYEIRNEFNRTGDYKLFFFLTRVCYNGLIRFNAKGGFNSPHHFGRDGIRPEKLKIVIDDWVKKLEGVQFYNFSYEKILYLADNKTLIFFDPPYFNSDNKLYQIKDVSFLNNFFYELENLNRKEIKWILTYDCSCNEEVDNKLKNLTKNKIIINHISGFKKLKNKDNKDNNLNNIKSSECIYLNY